MVYALMILLYNLLQGVLAPVIGMALCAASLHPKYRQRLGKRLGMGLEKQWRTITMARADGADLIWIHALSVGEVISARPLVEKLRKRLPDAFLLLTTTTAAGERIALQTLATSVDMFIPAPLDFLPVVRRFVHTLHPVLYVQIETDFWPNLLFELSRLVPARILVNGRVSEKSFQRYHACRFLSCRLLNTFSLLFMQTEKDARRMITLGLAAAKVVTAGNLKFDAALQAAAHDRHKPPACLAFLPPGIPRVILGSSHPGEEKILFDACGKLVRDTTCCLIVAPRDPGRGEEIVRLAAEYGMKASLRTSPVQETQILVVNTVGELNRLYGFCTVAVMGGSFSAAIAGHNPLEPAGKAVPVLFGPHMANFEEIARSLLDYGGAMQVSDAATLGAAVEKLLADEGARKTVGRHGKKCIADLGGASGRIVDTVLKAYPVPGIHHAAD